MKSPIDAVIRAALAGAACFFGATVVGDWLVGPLVTALGQRWDIDVGPRWMILVPLAIENVAVFGAFTLAVRFSLVRGPRWALVNPLSSLLAVVAYAGLLLEGRQAPPLYHWMGGDVGPSAWLVVTVLTALVPVSAFVGTSRLRANAAP